MLSELDLHAMRASREILQRELEIVGGVKFKARNCKCPFHDDQSPSADIYEKNGVWKFHCFTCNIDGDIFDVRSRLNKTTLSEELKKEGAREPSKPLKPETMYDSLEDAAASYKKVEAVYKYSHPDTGEVELAVIRWWNFAEGKKKFTQYTPRDGKWVGKGLPTNPIYNRRRVRDADTVVIVEGGEKGSLPARNGRGGNVLPRRGQRPKKADWTPLRGKKCVLWQDNDDPGTKWANEVRGYLRDLGCKIYRVCHETLELEEKDDVCDFVERYGSNKELAKQAIQDVLSDARPLGTLGDYVEETEKIIEGKRKAMPFPWRLITSLSRALMPGTVTCVFGPPGSAKTLWLCESLYHWIGMGIKACVFQLEDDRVFHLRRIHAQIAGNAHISSNEWVERNPDAFRMSRDDLGAILAEVGDSIWDAPDQDIDFEMLEKWVEERAKAGYEIIMIDPVTAAQANEKPWIADQKFIFKVKSIARRYNTRVILVSHPRKGQNRGAIGLDDMAGGAAYQRFSHSVLVLERNDKDEEVAVRRDLHTPPETITPDRIMRIAKARNGPGAGRRIAYQLRHDTMRFEEIGAIEKS